MMKILKPKFWDLKKPNLISYLLLPFTLPMIINNFLLSLKNKNNFIKIKTICVGNIYIGGTSKTPLTLKIYEILDTLNYKAATVKKFYKNQNDEQKILGSKTLLYCTKKRVMGVKKAINEKVDILIFDDGLQDRSINYDLRFVCFNSLKWIGNGFLIPAGPLREKLSSIKKYDAIFLNGHNDDNTEIKETIKKNNPKIKIFETFYKPMNIDKFDKSAQYLIFSGIGNPDGFKEILKKNNINIKKEIIYPDHHQYNQLEIDNIKLIAKDLNAKILTTEKDYVKIDSNFSSEINFLKIDIVIKKEKELIDLIQSKI